MCGATDRSSVLHVRRWGLRGWDCAADAYASAGPIPAPSTCVEASGEPPSYQFYPMSDVRMLMVHHARAVSWSMFVSSCCAWWAVSRRTCRKDHADVL